MANSVGSPFAASGTAQRLPDMRPLGHLIVRVSDASGTDRVVIRIHTEQVADAAHADFFLNAGESIRIKRSRIKLCNDVSILATSGTPNIYWGFA